MGLDLQAVGNHSIDFNQKSLQQIGTEVVDLLNKITFTNEDFMWYEECYPQNWDELESAKKEINWKYFIFEDDLDCIYFIIKYSDLFDFALYKGRIDFAFPVMRLSHWLMNPLEYVNEYRKILFQITTSLGGNMVYYYSDMVHDHVLGDNINFQDIESYVHNKFNTQSYTWEKRSDNGSFYIDNFKDIDWNSKYSLDKILKKNDTK